MKRHLLAITFLAAVACAGPSRPVPAPVRFLAMGGEGAGRLSRSDAKLQDGSVYQAWSFEAEAGQMFQIDVTSTEFDAYAILVGPAGSQLARDDDSGGNRNARIIYTAQRSGTYQVYANSLRRGQYGRYAVRLQSLGMASGGGVLPGTVGQIMRGQTMSGQLGPNDPKLTDGSVYQAWTYIGQAGETIQVDVMSADFDAYALVQDGNGSRLAADDDSGGGTNARITFTLPYSGAYRIVANTLRQGQYGSFSLSVR